MERSQDAHAEGAERADRAERAERAKRAERAAGALLGTFVGDALGMPFEGRNHRTIPTEPELEDARLGRGTYTDDTQMMIALAASLLACDGVDAEHLAAAFLAAYDPDRGYGRGTVEVFDLWRSGVPVAEAATRPFRGTGSRGNGAAMRIAPVGVRFAFDRDRLVHEAAASARVTHAHPVGVDAAVVQAAAVGAAMVGEDHLDVALEVAATDELRTALDQAATLARAGDTSPAQVHRAIGSSSDACTSVAASLCSAALYAGFEDAVRAAVRMGGDTDTTAAMTGAVVGAREGVGAIPSRWLAALEDGPQGASYVAELARGLAEAAV